MNMLLAIFLMTYTEYWKSGMLGKWVFLVDRSLFLTERLMSAKPIIPIFQNSIIPIGVNPQISFKLLPVLDPYAG
jgi:hypothetical protein